MCVEVDVLVFITQLGLIRCLQMKGRLRLWPLMKLTRLLKRRREESPLQRYGIALFWSCNQLCCFLLICMLALYFGFQAHVEYETAKRHYAHVDCPGHADYVKVSFRIWFSFSKNVFFYWSYQLPNGSWVAKLWRTNLSNFTLYNS